MKTALWLLGTLGLLGAFDTIYFHEIRGQLPAHLPGLSPELTLHAGRSFIYVAVFGTLPELIVCTDAEPISFPLVQERPLYSW